MENTENGILKQKEIVTSSLIQFKALFECLLSVIYLLLSEIWKDEVENTDEMRVPKFYALSNRIKF